MKALCSTYSIVGYTDDPLSLPTEHFPIYFFQDLHPDLQTLWPQLKAWG